MEQATVDVSVVIPMRNAAGVVEEQLAALASQTFDGSWEIVVADNGSTDASVEVVRAWAPRVPHLEIVDASDRPGPSHARNVGAAGARGRLLAFVDADDVAAPTWLAELVAAAAGADVVGGALDDERLNPPGARRWRGPTGQADTPTPLNFLPFALSGNLAVRAEVWRAVGGFRTDYGHCEDVELSWRVQLAGYRLVHAPAAVVHYRHRDSLGKLAHQVFSWKRAEARLYRDFRDRGARRRPAREVLRSYSYTVTRLPYLAMSRYRRGLWVVVASENWGRIVGSIEHRVICP